MEKIFKPSEDQEKSLEKWKTEDVVFWAKKHFSDDVALNLKEQQMDGESLIMLVEHGKFDQFANCGFKSVGDQMKLTKLIKKQNSSAVAATTGTATASSTDRKDKLTLSEIKQLSETERKIYLYKRRSITVAAAEEWQGNEIPIFKNHPENLQKLDNLVNKLLPEAKPQFNETTLKKHILGSLNERRRNIRKGHDYEKPPSKRPKLEKKAPEAEDSYTTKGMAMPTTHEEARICTLKTQERSTKVIAETPEDEEETTNVMVTPVETSLELQSEGEDLSQESAKVVVMCAFGAHTFKEVARSQLTSAAKFFLKGEGRKLIAKADKQQLVDLLAPVFIDKEVVVLRDGANKKNLCREDVSKEGTF